MLGLQCFFFYLNTECLQYESLEVFPSVSFLLFDPLLYTLYLLLFFFSIKGIKSQMYDYISSIQCAFFKVIWYWIFYIYFDETLR